MSPSLRRPRRPGTNRDDFGADPAQTREGLTGIVIPEGGGTRIPTLGGGYRVGAAAGAADGDTPS